MNEQDPLGEKQIESIEHYNPVTVTLTETTGLLVVSAIAFILLFSLLRAQKRIQDLQEALRQEAKG
jgi:Trk-type K+ transport system membrane component